MPVAAQAHRGQQAAGQRAGLEHGQGAIERQPVRHREGVGGGGQRVAAKPDIHPVICADLVGLAAGRLDRKDVARAQRPRPRVPASRTGSIRRSAKSKRPCASSQPERSAWARRSALTASAAPMLSAFESARTPVTRSAAHQLPTVSST